MVACVRGLCVGIVRVGSQPDVSAAPMSTSAPIAAHSQAIGTPVIDTAGLEIDGADTIDAYVDGEASVSALVLDQGSGIASRIFTPEPVSTLLARWGQMVACGH